MRIRFTIGLHALIFIFLLSPHVRAQGFSSLLVPTFLNLTGDTRLDWIGEGFARTTAQKLDRLPGISSAYLRTNQSVDDASADLTRVVQEAAPFLADAVLLGSVVRGSDADLANAPLVITVRIVRPGSLEQVSSLELTGIMEQLFSMEADLATFTAEKLGYNLRRLDRKALRRAETRSLYAYKEMVLGTLFFEDGDALSAIIMFERALEHHTGIFYAHAHHLLAKAYAASGKKVEMLARMKKDAAELSTVYFKLAEAQEFSGDLEEAAFNLKLFLKYTDKRTRLWQKQIPGWEVVSYDNEAILLRSPSGGMIALSWLDGEVLEQKKVETTLQGAPPTIPEEELSSLVTEIVLSGDRYYYGLKNGYVIGRAKDSGERIWAYRMGVALEGPLAVSRGRVAAINGEGEMICVAAHEWRTPNDLSAYLKLAGLAERNKRHEEAEQIYTYIVENVQFNVPEAWRRLWEQAKDSGDDELMKSRWEQFLLASY